MQLYVGDYLGDTRHLSTEQHGAYLLLLMSMWRSDGWVPHDEQKLARLTGLTLTRWRKIAPEVMELMVVAGGKVTQKRLAEEFAKATEKSRKRSEAGHAGGVAKALKDNNPPLANATPLLQHLPEPESEPERKKKKDSTRTPSASGKARASLPDQFPSPEAKAAAVLFWQKKGRPDLAATVDDQADQFRDHHAAHGGKMLNWEAAWRTWVRNALQFTRPPMGQRPAPVPTVEPDLQTWVTRLGYFYDGDSNADVDKGYWSTKWGPPPGMLGCQVPPAAEAAYRARKSPPRAAPG